MRCGHDSSRRKIRMSCSYWISMNDLVVDDEWMILCRDINECSCTVSFPSG